MNVFAKLYYMVAPYTDPRERRVAKFFAKLREHTPQAAMRKQLIALLQHDTAVINLWTEHRYKGYTYLHKRMRKNLYANLDAITVDFDVFWQGFTSDEPDEHRKLLTAIMAYFRDTYTYRESSSFGRLLRDPNQEKLVGDCNQIVTLYIHLYSRYCPISELQLRLMPGHVALHYKGVDIETTNGTIKDYTDTKNARLVPIEEIVSINLLDTTDENFTTHQVAPQDFLQAARLAYMLSSDRAIVAQNLDAAYGMMINQLMKRHDFARALAYAKQSKAADMLAIVGHNGAAYALRQNQFKTARNFAQYSLNRADLLHDITHAEGVYYYNQQKYNTAIPLFAAVGDTVSVQKCYEGLFFVAQSQLPKQLTTQTVGNHRKTIAAMRDYAKKSGNSELLRHVDELRRHIK